jgi:hypothetical protein
MSVCLKSRGSNLSTIETKEMLGFFFVIHMFMFKTQGITNT